MANPNDPGDVPAARSTARTMANLISSLTENRNPFEGRTVYTERPNSLHAEDRAMTPDELVAAQRLWDEAEQMRKEKSDRTVHTLLSSNETREEPASKALENRLRIRFLSTKGATMQGWIAARDEIIAEHMRTAAS